MPVSERFSAEAKGILEQSRREAAGLKHNYVGTEHVLLALANRDGTHTEIFTGAGVDPEKVAGAVLFIIGRGNRSVLGDQGWTERTRNALELTVEVADRLGHDTIEPKHILLGLAVEGHGIAAGILESLGLTPEVIRDEVRDPHGGSERQ